MVQLKTLFLALAVGVSATACSSFDSQSEDKTMAENAMTVIQGEVGYRERIALLPGATLRVALNDISKADAPAETLAAQQINLDGRSVPVSYKLLVPSALLKPGMTYAVRADIRGPDQRLLWTTDTVHAIDVAKADQTLAPITLIKVGAKTQGNVTLTSAPWQVETINGTAVVAGSKSAVRFDNQGRISGLAGCNNFTGQYQARNGLLKVGPLAMTQKDCVPKLQEQEASLLAILSAVSRYSFDSGKLVLKTADGRTIIAKR